MFEIAVREMMIIMARILVDEGAGNKGHVRFNLEIVLVNPQWYSTPWWHHQMEAFPTFLAFCAESWPLLLTWINFNSSKDKQLNPL